MIDQLEKGYDFTKKLLSDFNDLPLNDTWQRECPGDKRKVSDRLVDGIVDRRNPLCAPGPQVRWQPLPPPTAQDKIEEQLLMKQNNDNVQRMLLQQQDKQLTRDGLYDHDNMITHPEPMSQE